MPKEIYFSDYFRHRVKLRGFEIATIENILRYSEQRYFDAITHRTVVVGKHDKRLVIIPYEENDTVITPITIHATTRQQIKFRINSGRFLYE